MSISFKYFRHVAFSLLKTVAVFGCPSREVWTNPVYKHFPFPLLDKPLPGSIKPQLAITSDVVNVGLKEPVKLGLQAII